MKKQHHWMNRNEIENAVEHFRLHTILGPAANFLNDYKDLIDSCSDGWLVWIAGTNPASDLCDLLQQALSQRYRHNPDYVPPTWTDVVKACRRITTFVHRNKHIKDQVQAPTLKSLAEQAQTHDETPAYSCLSKEHYLSYLEQLVASLILERSDRTAEVKKFNELGITYSPYCVIEELRRQRINRGEVPFKELKKVR